MTGLTFMYGAHTPGVFFSGIVDDAATTSRGSDHIYHLLHSTDPRTGVRFGGTHYGPNRTAWPGPVVGAFHDAWWKSADVETGSNARYSHDGSFIKSATKLQVGGSPNLYSSSTQTQPSPIPTRRGLYANEVWDAVGSLNGSSN